MMDDLDKKRFALSHWRGLRPFFCRLTPEYIWDEVRGHIIEEVTEELQAQKGDNYEYVTYFTYPSHQQIERAHERGRDSNLFSSEIREVVGYRAAEALCVLAGFIRLEAHGSGLNLLNECFHKLWEDFSAHSYSRGYRTSEVGSQLALILGSNNVFSLVPDDRWRAQMLAYFQEANHDWSGRPLRETHAEIIKVLGGEPATPDNDDSVILRGVLPVHQLSEDQVDALCRSLWWEQGAPEEDVNLPPVMMSNQRRGAAQPTGGLYDLPLHRIRVECGDLRAVRSRLTEAGFGGIAVDLLRALERRTAIVSAMGFGKTFTLQEAAAACGVEPYAARLAVGQLIKVGLVDFDRYSGQPWCDANQEFVCVREAVALCGDHVQ